MKNNGKSRWRVKMCLAEGPPDWQISVDCVWQLLLDSVFAIHRRSVLDPKATPFDKNADEVHFVHFDDKQSSKHSSHGNNHCRKWVRTTNTDAKSLFHTYYKDGWRERPKIGLGQGPVDRQILIYRSTEGHFISVFVDWDAFRSSFGNTLGSSWAQKSSWRLYRICLLIRSRFSEFRSANFTRFWRPLREVFGDLFNLFWV